MNTAVNFRERMQVPTSKAEEKIELELINRGLSYFFTQETFCLLQTKPDFYYLNEKLAIYIDGFQVHKNREAKDEELRRLLTKRYGIQVLSYSYKAPLTKKRKKEICDDIEERVKGIREAKKR